MKIKTILTGLIIAITAFFGLNNNVQAAPAVQVAPKTQLQKLMRDSFTNAEQLLAALGDTLEEIVEEKDITERVEDLRPFLNWLINSISTKRADDSLFSRTAFFNRSNIRQLILAVEAFQQYFENTFVNNATVAEEFANFKKIIAGKMPMGAYMPEKPSKVERGIFRKNLWKFRKMLWNSRKTLTFATDSRDVLGNLADLYEELCISMSRTYVDFENFSKATDPQVRAYVAKRTQSLLKSIEKFLEKLKKNVSINEDDSSWWSKTPYFDRAQFTLLQKILLLVEDFMINKAAAPAEPTLKLFNDFFAHYGVTAH